MKCTIKLDLPSFSQKLEKSFDTNDQTPQEFLQEIISSLLTDKGSCSIKLEPANRQPVVHEMDFSQYDFGWTLSRMANRFDSTFLKQIEGKDFGSAGKQPNTATS